MAEKRASVLGTEAKSETHQQKRTETMRAPLAQASNHMRGSFSFFFLTSDFVPSLFLMKDTSQSVEFVFVFRQTFVNNMSHAFRRRI